MTANVIKIFLPTTLAFLIGIAITPRLSAYMYAHKLWKKKSRTRNDTITNATFATLHNESEELSTPRVGGIVIWLSVLLTIAIIWTISKVIPTPTTHKLDFFSRSQTLVPLGSLLLGSMLGLIDDILQINGSVIATKAHDRDIRFRYLKIGLITIAGILIGTWFYQKLGVSSVAIPFSALRFHLGLLFVPFFIMVLLAVFSGGVIDGMDGLAGGVLAIIFSGYAVIAFGKNQIDIAALCGVISGGLLAFLWFNIPPARFYMGETGMMGLLITLAVIAFLTDTVLLLPLIAFPLVITTASDIIQICSYKYFGKRRVFKIAPLHHHFHAKGWSKEKVVMRYWVVSIVCVISAVVIALISK
ncbi:MAG TPA: hypothetical protein VG621_02780 [Candidatus Paceibacterota bacterium]|nr:hypothetical protein [Candidatus Paceibacterota bacterium]